MLDKLKSLFVVEDEEDKKTNASGKTKSGEPTGAIKNEKKEVPISSLSPSSGKVNSKFLEVLLKAMDANDLDGFDYLEFKQSLKSLEKMPMDEKTRYQSAMAVAQTLGGSPQQLVQTAQHYINILKEGSGIIDVIMLIDLKSRLLLITKQKNVETTVKYK